MATVKGLDKLLGQIRSIPKNVAEAMEYQLSENAYELSDAIKGHAPVGKTHALADSVGYGPGDPPGDAGMAGGGAAAENPVADALDARGIRYSVWAGSKKAYYARWVEFGTRAGKVGDKASDKSHRVRTVKRTHPGTKGHPFFYPTIRARQSRLKTNVVRVANRALKKSAT